MELKLMNMETKVKDIRDEIKAKLKSGDTVGAKRLAAKQVKITENMKKLEGAMIIMEEQELIMENTLKLKDVMSPIIAPNYFS